MALPVACPFLTLRVPDVRSDFEVGSLRTNYAKSLTGGGLHHPPPLHLCSGAVGMADVPVIEALQRAMVSGRKVVVESVGLKLRRPSLRQERRKPAIRKQKLIHARAATD